MFFTKENTLHVKRLIRGRGTSSTRMEEFLYINCHAKHGQKGTVEFDGRCLDEQLCPSFPPGLPLYTSVCRRRKALQTARADRGKQ